MSPLDASERRAVMGALGPHGTSLTPPGTEALLTAAAALCPRPRTAADLVTRIQQDEYTIRSLAGLYAEVYEPAQPGTVIHTLLSVLSAGTRHIVVTSTTPDLPDSNPWLARHRAGADAGAARLLTALAWPDTLLPQARVIVALEPRAFSIAVRSVQPANPTPRMEP